MFDDGAFRDRHRLSAVNSINWARVLAQVVYYVTAAARPRRRPGRPSPCRPATSATSSPAGWPPPWACPVERLMVATNRNDILTRWSSTGSWRWPRSTPPPARAWTSRCRATSSACSSSCTTATASAVAGHMAAFRADGPARHRARAARPARGPVRRRPGRRGRGSRRRCGRPTSGPASWSTPTPRSASACGRHASGPTGPIVALATARPAKFPDAVEAATGVRPPLPAHLADLLERPERYVRAPNDLAAVQGRWSQAAVRAREARRVRARRVRRRAARRARRAHPARGGGHAPPRRPGPAGRGGAGGGDPRRPAAGQRRRQHDASSATTRARYHTGRAPDRGRRPRAPARAPTRSPSAATSSPSAPTATCSTSPAATRAPRRPPRSIAALDAALGLRRGLLPRRRPVPPHRRGPGGLGRGRVRPAPRPVRPRRSVWPTGPAAPRPAPADGGVAARCWPAPGLAANQVWLWGQGTQPVMPPFRDAYGVDAALTTAVDLIRGLGVLTGIEVVEVGRAPPAGTTPTTRASATPACGRWPAAPTCSSSTSRPPTRPATPATWRRRCGPSSSGTGASSGRWSRASTPSGPGASCCSPTTPRRWPARPTPWTPCRGCSSTPPPPAPAAIYSEAGDRGGAARARPLADGPPAPHGRSSELSHVGGGSLDEVRGWAIGSLDRVRGDGRDPA